MNANAGPTPARQEASPVSRSLIGRPRRLIPTVENAQPHEPPLTVWANIRNPAELSVIGHRPKPDNFGSPLKQPGTLLNERRLDEFTSRDLIAAQPCFRDSLIRDQFVRCSPVTAAKTKTPPSTKPGALRCSLSRALWVPRTPWAGRQEPTQAKPACMGETRSSFTCDSTAAAVDHILVTVSSSGPVQYWTPRQRREETRRCHSFS